MDFTAQAPAIPARNHRHTQRRRSLPPPSSSSSYAPKSSSPNRVNIKPASPEVISSLISSLSAISSPVNSHFEHFPISGPSHSTPTSPNAHSSAFPALGVGGSIRDLDSNGAYTNLGLNDGRDHHFLHPDDAALPPVVRTSKHSAGLSAIATGKSHGLDSTSSKAYHRGSGRPGSRGSESKIAKDKDDTGSIGSVSIERGSGNRDSTASHSSTGSIGRKSGRHSMGLMYMSSKERLRDKESERKRASVGAVGGRPEGLGLESVGEGRLSLPPLTSEPLTMDDLIIEEPAPLPSSHLPVGNSSTGASPVIGKSSPILNSRDISPGGVGSGRYIPTRRSSRQKTSVSHSPSKRQHSRHSSQTEAHKDLKEIGQGSRSRDSRSRYSDTQGDFSSAGGDRGRREKARATCGQDEKEYPSVIVTNDPPMKLQSSSNNSSMPQSGPSDAPADSKPNQTTHLDEIRSLDEEEAAPSPAIVQRKSRNSGYSSATKPDKATKQSSSTKTSLDLQWQSQNPPRSSSRLKRFSQPSSPPSHGRSFSSSMTRNQESQSSQPAPLVVLEDRPSSADSIDDAVDAYLCSPRLSQKIRHPQTGRVISFSEVGASEGFAVFCCVGMGLTRYITAFYDELALTLKLRLITPDRPGVGESEPYADGTGTPLSWPDDVYAICQALKITKFSILAHSAGAIYALATALRMPQHIRGRIHLLAPWIPPSQMAAIGSQQELPPAGALPTSQRILRALPTPILKAANSSFMSATSSSITSSLPKAPRRKRTSSGRETPGPGGRDTPKLSNKRDSLLYPNPHVTMTPDLDMEPMARVAGIPEDPNSKAVILAAAASTLAEKERQSTYDARLTHAIWALATRGANPAVDLLICLERRQTIGFRYVDITRSVVIHHGSRDTRVPVENVKWLGKTMRRCEVRVLQGEGHGLMASASVMSGVLMEIAKEWEDWMRVVHGRGGTGRRALGERGNEWGA